MESTMRSTMKKLITVCQVLVVAAVVSAVLAYGGDVIKGNFSEITLNGTKITSWDNVPGGGGSDNASNLTKGGLDNIPIGLVTPRQVVATTIATDCVTNTEFSYVKGVTSAIQTQLNAKQALDNGTFTGEVQGSQFVSTGGDNTHFVQVPNSGTPPIPATDNAGIIWFSTADNTLKITKSDGSIGSVTITW